MANPPANSAGFPPADFPIADSASGRLTEPWMRLLLNLWNKTGGTGSNDIDFIAPAGEFIVSIQGTVVGAARVNLNQVLGQLSPEQLPELVPGSLLGNPTPNEGPTANPTATAFLDEVFGSTEGMLLTRGQLAWEALGAGSNGDVLTSSGPGGLLAWEPAPGSSGIELASGSLTLAGVETLTISSGLTLSGSGASGTITSGGSSAGTIALGDPTNGISLIGQTKYNRPLLASMTLVRATTSGPIISTNGLVQEFNTAGVQTGPLVVSSTAVDAVARGAVIPHGQSGTFTVFGLMTQACQNADPITGPYCTSGICLYETSSGKAVLFGFNNGGGNPNRLELATIDNTGAIVTQVTFGLNTRAGALGPMWLALEWDGISSAAGFFSADGMIWVNDFTGSIAGYFSGTPDQMGFLHYQGNQGTGNVYGLTVWQLAAKAGAPQ